jgi:hypothetical protein
VEPAPDGQTNATRATSDERSLAGQPKIHARYELNA